MGWKWSKYIFKGLKSGSATGKELPYFVLSQVKAGNVNDQSSSFEIRARRGKKISDVLPAAPLDNGLGALENMETHDLIAFHARTYGDSKIAVLNGELDTDFDAFESIPHNGANFGFNMNNPDGFNICLLYTSPSPRD